MSTLSLSKQLYTADINYKGTLAKRDRDNTLMIGRHGRKIRLDQDTVLSKRVRSNVQKQQYLTNTHRLDEIKKTALERYDEELEGLNSLSRFVKQRGSKIRHKE